MFDRANVESMYDIKKFLKERYHKDDEAEHIKKYGELKADGNRRFDIILIKPGLARIQVMKLLRTELNVSLEECKNIVNNAPQVITHFYNAESATNLASKFEDLGAEIELK